MARLVVLGLAISLAIAGAAHAGPHHKAAHPAAPARPTATQAKEAAAAWIAALAFKADKADLAAAAAKTGLPFYSVAYDDNGTTCAEGTAKTAPALDTALGCLHAHADGHGRIRAWTKRDTLHLWGPLKGHAARLKTLEKTATLVIVDDGCLSEETTLILAIASDGPHGARVTAALAQDQSCGE